MKNPLTAAGRALLGLSLIAAGAGLAAIATAGPAAAASFQQVTNFGNNPSNLRMYLYVPTRVQAKPPILVAVHYCSGSASAFYNGGAREWVTAAEQYGYLIVFPEATRSGSCFDVYSPQALTRGGGSDPAGIMSMVTYAQQQHNGDPNRVYVMGASSGAMMTNVLAGVYPDVFKAGVSFSGVPATCFATGSSTNTWNSQCSGGTITKTAQQWGDAARAMYPGYTGPRPRLQLWHGATDTTLSYHNFGEAIKQWTNVHGISQTPAFTDSPAANWTRTRYGNNSAQAPVEGISISNTGHTLPQNGMAAYGIRFLGLDQTTTPTTTTTTTTRPTTTTTTTTSRPPTTTTTTTRPTSTTTTTSPGTPGSGGTLVTPGGKCLGVSGTANASSAQIQTCNGGSGQSWSFASDGTLRTVGGSMCLDASGRGTANGTALIIYACHGEANQRFSQGSNSSIVNAGSSRCVDVPNGSTTDGTGVQLYDCWGGDPQKWTLRTSGNPTTTTTTTTTTTSPPTTTTTTTPPTTTTTTAPPTTTTTTTGDGGGHGSPGCAVAYTLTGSWGGGFQGDVTITNTGTGAIGSWTVTMNLNAGQSIQSLWGGVASGSTGSVTVRNADYNGAIGAGARTNFGFVGGGNGSPVPTVTCTANGG